MLAEAVVGVLAEAIVGVLAEAIVGVLAKAAVGGIVKAAVGVLAKAIEATIVGLNVIANGLASEVHKLGWKVVAHFDQYIKIHFA